MSRWIEYVDQIEDNWLVKRIVGPEARGEVEKESHNFYGCGRCEKRVE